MDQLEQTADAIRAAFEEKHAAREQALSLSRVLIQHCSKAIRTMHRDDWNKAQDRLAQAADAAEDLLNATHDHPDLYHAGYTQDALKEYVEAHIVYALVRDEAVPLPTDLGVEGSTYLKGLAEGASELRRRCLDVIRRGDNEQAEILLDKMDSIYDVLMGFDFPDAITGGLRRRVDQLRGVLERTRGDLTNSLRQQRLRDALISLEQRLDLD